MKKRQVGFTLVELLIYMGLLSAVLIVIANILVVALDDRLESETGSSVLSDGRFMLARLMYDVGRTENIVLPSLLGDETSSLQIVVGGINYIYAVNNGNLVLTNGVDSDQLNSIETTVSNLTFKRLGNLGGKNTVQIRFDVVSKALRRYGQEIKNFQTTVGTR